MTERDATRPGSRWWPPGPIPALLAATVVLSAVFLLLPALDIWFSRQFYDAEIGFPVARLPAFVWLRWFAGALVWAIGGALVISLLLKLARPRSDSLIPVPATVFLATTLALGPGLLVNGILKSIWGRPRPVEILEFGGTTDFVPAWHLSDFCARNCSFVSGEASTAIWLVALALVVPLRWRMRVAAAALVLAALFSLNRVAFGAHFLSDVLLSWSLTLLVVAVVHRVVLARPPGWLREDRLEAAMTRAGLGIRRLIRREPRPEIHADEPIPDLKAATMEAVRGREDPLPEESRDEVDAPEDYVEGTPHRPDIESEAVPEDTPPPEPPASGNEPTGPLPPER